MNALAAVAVGSALGGCLRWGLSAWLNPRNASLPLGTLASNLIGGYLVGVAVAFFASNSALSPEWRLFCITGFLGGLTTFSSFSAESVAKNFSRACRRRSSSSSFAATSCCG